VAHVEPYVVLTANAYEDGEPHAHAGADAATDGVNELDEEHTPHGTSREHY
jgi:hypothetical protein